MANMTFGTNILPKANANVSLGNSDNPWTIISPNMTGTPVAPTAAAGTNTSQVATTAFVKEAVDTAASATIPVSRGGTGATNATDAITNLGLSDFAPKHSPQFVDSVTLGSRNSGATVGSTSFSSGISNTASGVCSVATGSGTVASGAESHAEGSYTTASGSYSHAEGLYVSATRLAQYAFGTYNVPETGSATTKGTYVEIVGVGTGSSAKANGRVLDWNGNQRLKGTLYINCDADSTGGKAVLSKGSTWGALAGKSGY